ncbi:rhombosortase [Vibrio sp. V27_P1S3P104]|uniref:rhombosortase n=1 Tax=unclassified Vibrio TaxID=2614977 RepID=UPI0013731306|nr:rhombosortase [Vibrio sp. V28_P6S34P95]NAX05588.1 rhombosortase [Vibrio sp. V30_P3S12P165]NAX33198.1 rhombosortase [Vibrio sp. V29_P1S30P107]NAX38805.1 rhombosortase [Vibrio sp. V27_P1S3P104]NAX41802.1 rhombosortase [Vibrio sp. V26_P1S5P106]
MNLYLVLCLVSLLCLGLQFEPFSSLSAWHRIAIEQGQWWRILTGNLTHTNFVHLTMNLAGLWAIALLFRPTAKSLLVALIILSGSVGIGVYFTHMTLYVGLSGTLHGLFAFFAAQEWLHGRKSSRWLVVGVIAKVVWEQWFGASLGTEIWIEARVATEAHLIGLIAGILCAILEKGYALKIKRPN